VSSSGCGIIGVGVDSARALQQEIRDDPWDGFDRRAAEHAAAALATPPAMHRLAEMA
jgi:hypothetical protein